MSGDDAIAAPWVQSVTPAEIVRQRQLGWPDFHPEDFCHVCGHRNAAPWSAPAAEWSAVVDGHGGIFCPSCFTTLYAAATDDDRVCWELRVTWKDGAEVPHPDAARLRSLAARMDSQPDRGRSFTGAEVAAMLRDGEEAGDA